MDDLKGTNLIVKKVECLDRYTGALNNLIQLESGRLVVPFSTLNENTGTFESATIYSDDEGSTWKVSNQVTVTSKETHVESGAVEPVVAEAEKNTLVMIIRTVLGRFYYSVSKDGGKSWSDSRKSNIKSSNSPAVLQKLNDGNVLIVWNNCNGMPMRGVRYSMARQCLHAAVSEDGLKTFKGIRMIVNKEKDDPDNVLNCYPFAAPADEDMALLRIMTVQSKNGETWREPGANLISLNTDFLHKTGFHEGKAMLSVKASGNKPGYEYFNYPYGQKGTLELHYENSSRKLEVHFILSDNYIDVSNFTLGKEDEKYREYIEENYIDIPVAIDAGEGRIKISWDNEITVESCGMTIVTESSFAGFNHLGVLLHKGEIVIKGIMEQSEKAWLDTGIEY